MSFFSFIPGLIEAGAGAVGGVVSSITDIKNIIKDTLPRLFEQTLELELVNKGADFDFKVGYNSHDVVAVDKDGNRIIVGRLIDHRNENPNP